MYTKTVVLISEARRRLPELVRKVSLGHSPIAIGRRGKVEAVLVAPATVSDQSSLRPLQGLVELVGDLEAGSAELARALTASLERTARQLDAPTSSCAPSSV